MAQILIEGFPVRFFSDTGFDHLYLVFRDDDGAETVVRGGPSGVLGTGFIAVEDGVPLAESADARPIDQSEKFGARVLDLGGRDPADVWEVIRQHARAIDAQRIPFGSLGENSNSVIASVLHVVGLPVDDNLPDQPDDEDVYAGTQYLLDRFDFVLSGTPRADLIAGAAADDRLAGAGGDDTLRGGAGDDILGGGAGADLLSGGDDADFLNGGWGHDRLAGGAGADRFYHAGVAGHGADWILDFDAADGDVLVFGGTARPQDLAVAFANTPGAGSQTVAEAFVLHQPTGRIIWALADGADATALPVWIGGSLYDLLA
jgi:hypothetical protein